MLQSPRRSLMLSSWVLVVLSAVGTLSLGCSSGCREDGQRMFETTPQRPRPIMIAIRSFRGSKESTVVAAQNLVYANARFGASASENAILTLAATSSEPAHVIGSVTLVDSARSVSELLELMSAVTERFTPVPDPDPEHPVLKLELWWVAGVHGKVAQLELPDPRILDEKWANHFFAMSASGTVVNAGEQGQEERGWVGRVARMWERERKHWDGRTRRNYEIIGKSIELEGGIARFDSWASDEADLLAQVAESGFLADIFSELHLSKASFRAEAPFLQEEMALSAMEARALDWFEPIALELPEGLSLAERCRRWLREVRRKVIEANLAVRRVVLFDVTSTRLRGMLIGERVAAAQMTPQIDLDAPLAVEHWEKVVDKGVAITLRVPLPTVEVERSAIEADASAP